MILLTVMPVENKKNFIDKYFKVQNSNEIFDLLEDTVGDIDNNLIFENEFLQNLLSQVRQQRYKDEFNRLNEEQKKICITPYDKNLLINAVDMDLVKRMF